MAQQVEIAGVLFNNVPYIQCPDGNGVYHQFLDTTITSNAAAASDIASGKLAFVNGELVTGTASGGGATLITKSITANGTYNASSDNADGYSSVTVNVSGGGGLVYETGTWTPASDVSTQWITFANSHTEAPFYYAVFDATGTYDSTLNSNYMIEFLNVSKLSGKPYYVSSTSLVYARHFTVYRANSATNLTTSGGNINTPDVNGYATNEKIFATTASASRYWRTGRTYKWIAVWSPTS